MSSRGNKRDRGTRKPVIEVVPVASDAILFLFGSISTMLEKKQTRFLEANYGLTLPQFQLMMAAAATNPGLPTLGSLAESVDCSRGNLTGVADRLERDGWITRVRNEGDRRVVNIMLTEKGAKIHEVHKELSVAMAGIVKLIPEKERAAASTLLSVMYKGLKNDSDATAVASAAAATAAVLAP